MSFLGAWQVSEYVYNPDGTFAGLIRQRRELLQLENGRIQVTQHCQPDAALANHPMARFSGTPVFELSVDGRFRRYHGPAVVGTGIPWGEGAMTGSGMWPQFGHNFRSFAILAAPDRQLTGGKFFNATEMIANIVGVAAPEAAHNDFPTLSGPTAAEAIARDWRGQVRRVLPNGEVQWETEVARTYSPDGSWRETTASQPVQTFAIREQAIFETGASRFIGAVKQTGWLLEAELHDNLGQSVQIQELLDAEAGHLVSLRRWLQNEQLQAVDVVRLQPTTGSG